MGDLSKLVGHVFPTLEQTYERRDTILYALGVGLGRFRDPRELRYVYEHDLASLPTFAVVLATPGMWVQDPRYGIDWTQVLHGEQGVEIHEPLPPSATVRGVTRIVDIIDKGAGKGALVLTRTELTDRAAGTRYATLTSTAFCRAEGGFGGRNDKSAPAKPLPSRAPDVSWDFQTRPEAAAIYRLSGDDNPLHIDPEIARKGGFDRPILHGLCTFGIAGHAVLRSFCDYDAARLTAIRLRFANPVYPGETVRTEMWVEGEEVVFRCLAVERGIVVTNNGLARLRAAASPSPQHITGLETA